MDNRMTFVASAYVDVDDLTEEQIDRLKHHADHQPPGVRGQHRQHGEGRTEVRAWSPGARLKTILLPAAVAV